MGENITLKQVKHEALKSIQLLREGKTDVKTASEIRNNLNVIVEIAKTEVEFIKVLSEDVKKESLNSLGDYEKVAETIVPPSISLDESLNEIDNKAKEPYAFNQ